MIRERITVRGLGFPLVSALVLVGCGDDDARGEDDANSGFTDSGMGVDSGTRGGTDDSETDGTDQGTDTSDLPDDGTCDAGHEAFVQRLVMFVQGRKPESIREVRLLVQMIEQLDAMGGDGRAAVARGLARGDRYLERWKTHLFEELRVNVTGDRRNDLCYDLVGSDADSPELAAWIRDNTADAVYPGPLFWMPDVVYSALRLDDLSPAYRADLFARMSVPIIAGNVDQFELEVMRRANFGQIFEQAYLGRKTECNQCHRAEYSVTWDPNPELNRHWPLTGNFELAVYGPDAAQADENRSHAVFRFRNFAWSVGDYFRDVTPGNARSAFGMGPVCGEFVFPGGGEDILGYAPFMVSDYTDVAPPNGVGANVYHLDVLLQQGFESLRRDGLVLDADNDVSGPVAAAYLFSMNVANHTWREAMGYPLTVANNFPRNQAQRDILQQLTEAFVSDGYSLRSLVTEIALHEAFNQAAPAACGNATPYNLPAIFDPFTREAEDPDMRGNGVGDGVHRLGGWVLLDAISQAMWWDKPQRFGPDQGEVPGSSCGAGMVGNPCDEAPQRIEVLRDVGAFLSDSEGGFEGTDFVSLLRLEREYGRGEDPGFGGACSGPLGGSCDGLTGDWVDALMDQALATPGTDMWDLAVAVKDRLITEPVIHDFDEAAVLADVMGVVDLSETVADVGAAAAEEGVRRLVGVLVGTPQFLLVGVPPSSSDFADEPALVVPGTSTLELCEHLAPLVLVNPGDGYDFGYTCSASGVQIAP